MSKRLRRRTSRIWVVPVALGLVFLVMLIAPLVWMFGTMDRESVEAVFGQEGLGKILADSVTASVLTTVISLTLAYPLAWCMVRSRIPCKRLLRLALVLPMLIPSVSIGMGVVLLGGNNGLLTNLLGIQGSSVYGLTGIVWGSVMYTLPVAFVMIENILKYEDSAPYEAARVLGIGKWHRFKAITFPYLRKPMISVAFSVFTLSFTDYGVPLMVGGKFKTLPMVMYQQVIGQLDFGRGCVYGAILLVPAVIAFVVDMVNKNTSSSSFVIRPFTVQPDRGRDTAAMLYTLAMVLFSILPILSFLVLAFVERYPSDMTLTLDNFFKTIRRGGGEYLINSVVIAALVSVVGVAICIVTAYFTARTFLRSRKYLHLIAMSTGAIPGVVLGLAYVLVFKGSFLYGTLIILVMVNVVHFFSSPYLMMYTSFSKLNGNLEAVASTLKISRIRLLFDILLPRCARTIAEMACYFFVNCMMTISAVSFLANTYNKPIALMINQFEAQAQMEMAAVVSLMILTINIVVKVVAEREKD